MASEKRAQTSPEVRVFPPPLRVGNEEKSTQGYEMLQRLQGNNRPGSCTLPNPGRRRGSCITFGEKTQPEDVRTIKSKVKSTENISGKSLLAVDLLQSLTSKNGLQSRSNSAGLFRATNELQRCHTAENTRQRIWPSMKITRAASAGQAGHRRSASFEPQQQGMRNTSLGTQSNVLQVPSRSQQAVSPRLLNRRAASAKRCSLPISSVKEKRRNATSILRKYQSTSKEDDFEENDFEERETFSSANRTKSASSLRGNLKEENNNNINKKQRLKFNDGKFYSPKNLLKAIYPDSSDSDDASDDTSLKEAAAVRSKTHTISQDGNVSDSSSHSDSEFEEDNAPQKKYSGRKTNGGQGQAKERRTYEEGKKTRRTEKDDRSSESESESNGSRDDDHHDHEKKYNSIKIDSNNDSSDENSDSEIDDITCNTVDNMLLVDQELELLAKEKSTLGMPAVDLLETHEQFVHNRSNHKRKIPKEGKKVRRKKVENDEDLESDVEDLIDIIDDMIDADDNDLTYAAKRESKSKSFQRGVKLVMAAKKLAL